MKNTKKSVELRTLIARNMTLFLVVILASLWLVQVLFLDDFYEMTKRSEIKSAAKEVTNLVDRRIFDNKEALKIGEKYDVCIDVYQMNEHRGKLLMSADVLGHCVLHNTDSKSKFTIYKNAVENDGVYLEYFAFDPENSVYYGVDSANYKGSEEFSLIYAIIYQTQTDDILMIFNSSITPISTTVNTFYILLLLFSGVILLLTLVFAHNISKKIVEPLSTLTTSADKFGKGELSADFRCTGYTEAEKLSGALVYASEELAKTDRLRRDLLANLSHDLRTPITLINGYAELMKDIPNENTPENLDNIISESKRLSELIEDVLDYSKLLSGTTPFNPEVFSLTDQVIEITKRYQSMLKPDGITVNLDCGLNANVFGDAKQLSRVLVNYISNAVAHVGSDKTINVSVKISDDIVKVSVSDGGEGIPKEELGTIWDKYYKLSRNGTRNQKGAGLGLSIVKAIMEKSGGNYGVNSILGKGSTFWYSLKIVK